MSENTPTRLPRAFVRISVCPVCGYSLQDLAVDANCPECGAVIDRYLYTSVEMQNAVAITRTWCTLGSIAWGILGFVFWFLSMAMLNVNAYYFPGTVGVLSYVAVWAQSVWVLVPIVLSIRWWRRARPLIYKVAITREPQLVRPLSAAVVLNFVGILLLCGGCLLGILGSAS